MRGRLFWRTALPFALLLVLATAGLGVYAALTLRQLTIAQTGEQLLAEARLSGQSLTPMMAANPLDPAINSLAQRTAAAIHARVTVILPDGKVVGESELPLNQLENHLERPEVQAALNNRETTVIRYSTTLGIELLYAASPLAANGKVIGVVRLAYPLSQLQAQQDALTRSVALVTVLAAGLGVLLAFWLTSRIVRPVNELSSYVAQIEEGIFPEIKAPKGKDEVSELQNAFRDLYGQMRTRFNELRAERGKLEAVLMNMTDGIVIVDEEGITRMANPAALRLFETPANGQERSLVEVVRHHQIVDLWRKCLASGQQQTATIELTPGRYNIQVIATRLGEEMEGSVLLVFQDLTRVRRLETVRRDFISNVSHELRTPLASLKALAETLHEGALDDPPAARRFLSQMDTEIDNLTQMVRELLELSRIESGRVPLERKACDPCELMADSAGRMRLQAERAGLELELACSDTLPPVYADPTRIEQVMVNLIHNAVKFTPPGGKIEVGATARANEVVFFVKDSGVGIAEEDLGRIFERFYKADRSRSGGGTGLGLSIARHMIESHGGQIWAESQVGKGSNFQFTLPRA